MSRDQNGQYKNVKKSERFCAGIRTELLSSHRRDRAQQGELGVARNKATRSRTGNRLKAEKKEASSPRKGVIVKLTLSMLGRIGPCNSWACVSQSRRVSETATQT
uniref:Uncharacterized protein n=1 Tax=Oryza rufipogon TaxID=4529 RepID=A0A0E0RGT5_ORYRU